MRRRCVQRFYVAPEDFKLLRRMSRLSQSGAAALLGVTAKTIQNWEQGVSRIPYAPFKLLRVLRGHELPDVAWQGWTVVGDCLNSPNGRELDVASLNHLEQVFAMARLWRVSYARSGIQKPPSVVIPFPDLRKPLEAPLLRPVTPAKRRKG